MRRLIPILLLAIACGGKDPTDTAEAPVAVDDTALEDTATNDTNDTAAPDNDNDGYTADDCDDTDAEIHPGAAEVCDGIDNDCDGLVDPPEAADAQTWHLDFDGDGHGAASAFDAIACADSAGEGPEGYTADCDDADPSAHPGAAEICDGADNDCDGAIDDDPIDAAAWYADADSDGYGDPAVSETACEGSAGYVADDSDCDDTEAAVHPGAAEVCNDLDDDCDGEIDPDEAADAVDWYRDTDGDGYGDLDDVAVACDAPSGFVADDSDCDDGDGFIHPGATESCNGIDDDCDGRVDPDDSVDASPWYRDNDGDGYGDSTAEAMSCDAPSGYVADAMDCDDGEATVHPDASEVCNGIDDDCDEEVDPESAEGATEWYVDDDGDGVGVDVAPQTACDQPAGHVAESGDCDEANAAAFPGNTETWYDGVDGDCDGADDYDADGDGHRSDAHYDGSSYGDDCDDADASANPSQTEAWYDGVDGDCAGDDDYDADGDGYLAAEYGGADCDDADTSLPAISAYGLDLSDADAVLQLNTFCSAECVVAEGEIRLDDASLTDLSSLSCLTGAADIYLSDSGLTGLAGWEGLAWVSGELYISNNESLTDLTGLEALRTVGGSMNITYNDALEDVSAAHGLDSVSGSLEISHNSLLATSDAEALEAAIGSIGGGVTIANNAP